MIGGNVGILLLIVLMPFQPLRLNDVSHGQVLNKYSDHMNNKPRLLGQNQDNFFPCTILLVLYRLLKC